MDLDRELRRALARKSPAPGFAGRVLKRIERRADSQVRPGAGLRTRPTLAAAASLALVAITALFGAWGMHRHTQGERAREQVLLAMRIAGTKVHAAQEHVREIGTR